MHYKRRKLVLISLVLSVMLVGRYFRNQKERELQHSKWFDPRKRPDVIAVTDWQAPIVWEGTYDRRVLENYYRRQNITVGLAVFAAGRFEDDYLDLFLHSANKHFMPGYKVNLYVTVDSPVSLAGMELDPGRTFKFYPLSPDGPADPDLVRLQSLGEHIEADIRHDVQFLVSMTARQVFRSDVGAETLGLSVAQLHAWWYFRNTENVPYERRPQSTACIPFGQGDFYYDGAVLGGTPGEILKLINEILKGVVHDKKQQLNSTYESHLNKYFFLNKPTKLLSPEYNWDLMLRPPPQIRHVKVGQHSEANYG
ncbi:putative glycosyltransferase 6 domain-containing protein 1 [Dasypus novemcinctus]|uniref:putative glycosyltransferase 6 domain-containing protein 1 n=1 Tax=Dasypus novemcinctus TaxID=9361 RepID=UPI00265DE70C|nr:putative glycosyltransferase 6 domain-containing protein 1 isoform X1 [Dasypus novemcinctus]